MNAGTLETRPVDQPRHTSLDVGARSDVQALGEVLARLAAAPASVAELLAMVPRLVCELGFDRALLSRVDDGFWTSEASHVVDDVQRIEPIGDADRGASQQLLPGLLETEIVRRRKAVVVTDVHQERRVHRRIGDTSPPRSYVAVPIECHGRVVGLLHADRHKQGREATESDKDLLVAFVHGLHVALSHATMRERLRSVERSMSDALVSLQGVATDGHGAYFGAGRAPIIERSPASTSASAAAMALTERERQVFELIAEGRTNSAIARDLFIAESTVKRHVKHILRKLRARNRSEAIAIWFQTQNDSRREAP